MGAIDRQGRAVSFIQSVYWEWGSGVVVPGTGICWQNRGISFALDPKALNHLQPGRKPFHTLNPSLARFADGRVMPYGTMGGEGQPQTSAVPTRLLRPRRAGGDGAALLPAPVREATTRSRVGCRTPSRRARPPCP
jgi:gamma-glutamyltranspeptidase/glutathione hydrolase